MEAEDTLGVFVPAPRPRSAAFGRFRNRFQRFSDTLSSPKSDLPFSTSDALETDEMSEAQKGISMTTKLTQRPAVGRRTLLKAVAATAVGFVAVSGETAHASGGLTP